MITTNLIIFDAWLGEPGIGRRGNLMGDFLKEGEVDKVGESDRVGNRADARSMIRRSIRLNSKTLGSTCGQSGVFVS